MQTPRRVSPRVGDGCVHTLSLDTHSPTGREIERYSPAILLPSYLPKREVQNLQATLGTPNDLLPREEDGVCTGQWVAEGGRPILFVFHPLLVVAHLRALGDSQGVLVANTANTQSREPGLKVSPQFLCGKTEPPKDKTEKPGTPALGPLPSTSPPVLPHLGTAASQAERQTLARELLAALSVSQGSYSTTVIRKPRFGQQRATVKLTNVQVNPKGLLLEVRGKWPKALGKQVGKLYVFFNLRVT